MPASCVVFGVCYHSLSSSTQAGNCRLTQLHCLIFLCQIPKDCCREVRIMSACLDAKTDNWVQSRTHGVSESQGTSSSPQRFSSSRTTAASPALLHVRCAASRGRVPGGKKHRAANGEAPARTKRSTVRPPSSCSASAVEVRDQSFCGRCGANVANAAR